jgi:hypothetical protein
MLPSDEKPKGCARPMQKSKALILIRGLVAPFQLRNNRKILFTARGLLTADRREALL